MDLKIKMSVCKIILNRQNMVMADSSEICKANTRSKNGQRLVKLILKKDTAP